MTSTDRDRPNVEGTVAPGFEAVRDAFDQNFMERGELGAAFPVFYRGQMVVDLCGGGARPKSNPFVGPGYGHDRLLDDERGRSPYACSLSGPDRVGRSGRVVLARVRAGRQGADHRPPTQRSPGRPLRDR
jgi:hypothetical protein